MRRLKPLQNMRTRLLLVAVTALLLSACSSFSEQIVITTTDNNPTFTAYFDEEDTRTYLVDEKYIRWHEGDQLTIFNGTTLNKQYEFDGKTGANSGTFSFINNEQFGSGADLEDVRNYAIYPYQKSTTILEDGTITYELPVMQYYAENSFGRGANVAIAVTSNKNDNELSFKNACGYIRFKLYGNGDEVVRRVVLTAAEDTFLAGEATITAPYGGTPTLTMNEGGCNYIELDCSEGVTLGTSKTDYTEFWFALPPTTLHGFTLEVYTDNQVYTKVSVKDFVITRSIFTSIAPLKFEGEEYNSGTTQSVITYTSADGNIIEPYEAEDSDEETGFGAKIVSNTYSDGVGTITFNGEIFSIGSSAFAGTNLTSINIPEEVTMISPYAFSDCDSLVEIDIPNNVEFVDDGAFKGCDLLERVTLPENLIVVSELVFADCFSLYDITIPELVVTIYGGAFQNCVSLQSINIPGDVADIYGAAFYGCSALKTVYIEDLSQWCSIYFDKNTANPLRNYGDLYLNDGEGNYTMVTAVDNLSEELTYIGQYAFYNCVNLNSIVIPDSVEEIGANAFCGCSLLRSATLPTGITKVDVGLFYGCKELESIVLPAGVTAINNFAFYDCYKLASVNIPEGVNSISMMAFYGCKSLQEAIIPDSVTSLGISAFYGCSALENVKLPAGITSLESNLFRNCAALKSITIPEGVKTIGNWVFYGCSALPSIVLPSTTESIGNMVFFDCSALTELYCEAIEPPTLGTDPMSSATTKIYVPAIAVDDYKRNWANYIDYIAVPDFTGEGGL